MKIILSCSFLLCTLLFCNSFAQSPWTKSKSGGFAQLSYTNISKYNSLFLSNGDVGYTERNLIDNTAQIYVEYGITDKLTVVGIVAYKFEKAGETNSCTDCPTFAPQTPPITESGSLNGLTNPSLALRYKLPSNKFSSAFQIKTDFPMNTYDAATGLSTGYSAFTFLPMLSAGKGFNNNNYAFVYGGYGIRTGGYNHFVNTGLETGHRFFEQLWLIAFLDVNKSMNNTAIKIPLAQSLTAFYVPDQEYFAYGFKLIEELNNNIGLTAGVGGSFSGNMVAHSPALSIGGYYKW